MTSRPSSSSGNGPSSFHPIKELQRASVAEAPSTSDKRGSHQKRPPRVLKRNRSSSSVGNQSLSSFGDSNGSRLWSRSLSRSWTPGNAETNSQPERQSVMTRLLGRRLRRNSDSTPPSRFSTGKEPISPLAGSSVIPGVPTDAARIPKSPNNGLQERPRVFFYNRNEPYYGFTNFSSHPVKYDGKMYPTSEHLFQSFKVCR